MRNLTLSVPDEVYRKARVKAAEQGRSLSALVAEFLSSLAKADEEFERLVSQEEQVLSEIEDFRAGDRLGRGEVHERGLR